MDSQYSCLQDMRSSDVWYFCKNSSTQVSQFLFNANFKVSNCFGLCHNFQLFDTVLRFSCTQHQWELAATQARCRIQEENWRWKIECLSWFAPWIRKRCNHSFSWIRRVREWRRPDNQFYLFSISKHSYRSHFTKKTLSTIRFASWKRSCGHTRSPSGPKTVIWKTRKFHYNTIRHVCTRWCAIWFC